MTPEQLARRNAAIRVAWDDVLRLALMRVKKERPNSKRASKEAYNAYHRDYQRRLTELTGVTQWRRRAVKSVKRRKARDGD